VFRVTAEVYTGGDVAPAPRAPSGYDPGPSYNPYPTGVSGGARWVADPAPTPAGLQLRSDVPVVHRVDRESVAGTRPICAA